MLIDFEPGDYVKNPANTDWGIGQVQSIIGNKVTVNFENLPCLYFLLQTALDPHPNLNLKGF